MDGGGVLLGECEVPNDNDTLAVGELEPVMDVDGVLDGVSDGGGV